MYDPNLIINFDNRNDVIDALIEDGHSAPALHLMTPVELANLYHDRPPVAPPTAEQRMGADILMRVMAALPNGGLHGDVIRSVAREEAQKLIDTLPPRRLEVTGPKGTVSIDGIQHHMTDLVIKIASIGHAILLVGPAGCGKTTIGEHAARALQLPFYITSTINDTHELMGFVDGHGKYHDTPFRQAFEHGGLWIADEIDAWDASALLAANSALANGYANFPDRSERVHRHTDFRMVATANTFGTGADRVYVGRNELDAASLDRFATIEIDYDLNLEQMFAGDQTRWLDRVWKIRKRVNEKNIRHVVSSRAIGMGAAALAIGIEWNQVNDIYLFKGMSSKDRSKVDGT